MRAVSEGQRCRAAAAWSKLVGLIKDGWITIGGSDDNQNLLTSGYVDTADEPIFGRRARRRLHRPVESKQLDDQRWMRRVEAVDDAGAVWTRGKQPDDASAQQVGGGLMTGDRDEDRGDDHVIELQVGVRGDETEQVVARVGTPVGGQRKELGDKRCESCCARSYFLGVGERRPVRFRSISGRPYRRSSRC